MLKSSIDYIEFTTKALESLSTVVDDLLAITSAEGTALIQHGDSGRAQIILGKERDVCLFGDLTCAPALLAMPCGKELVSSASQPLFSSPYIHIHPTHFMRATCLACDQDNEHIKLILVLWGSDVSNEAVSSALELAQRPIQALVDNQKDNGNNQAQRAASMQDKIELLNEIGSISRTGGWEFDVATQAIEWTEETYRLYGLTPGRKISFPLSLKPFSPEAREKIIKHLDDAINLGKSYEIEVEFQSYDGREMILKASGRSRFHDGKVTHVYGALEDITEQRRLSDMQHSYLTYVTAILDNLNDAVLTADPNGMIITANETVEKIFGYTPDELIGQDVTVLMNDYHAQRHGHYVEHYLLTGEDSIFGNSRELSAKRKDGSIFPIELSLSEVDLDGQKQFVSIIRDITERKQATDHMYRVAYYDEVTELPNLKSLERDVKELIIEAKETGQDLYCCMVDVDNFAQYNVSFGNETGDYILKIVSERIQNALTDDFSAYRGIGDNFFILYRKCVAEHKPVLQQLNNIEWRLHTDIMSEMTIHGHSHVVTSAVASAHIKGDSATYEKVIGVLEFGKRRAKSQGHGGRVSLEKSAFADYERHNMISQSFSRAIENNEFYLMLQPQYDANHNIVASEALLRWEHGQFGFISPGEFIPIAETSDAIVDIGIWVLNEACRLLAEMKKMGVETSVAVNISGRHIARPDFSQTLLNITNKWEISPHQIILEITETTLVSGIDLVRRRIERLSEIGFAFSIDDFGTGYSSLSYLKELPIKELKIDRYFVDEINFAGEDVPIVNTIIDMAHAMGVRTVAEGIENDIQMLYLKQKGCDIFQGFFLDRPLPVEQWMSLLTLPHKSVAG